MFTKEQLEYAREKSVKLSETLLSMETYLNSTAMEAEKLYSDTIINLAITSGAIAALSLTLFISNLNLLAPLLVLGVSVLLINVVVAFYHLIDRSTDRYKDTLRAKREMRPMEERSQDMKLLIDGTIDFEEWKTRYEGFISSLGEQRELEPLDERLVHWDTVILILLALAISLIIASFMLPMFVNWN